MLKPLIFSCIGFFFVHQAQAVFNVGLPIEITPIANATSLVRIFNGPSEDPLSIEECEALQTIFEADEAQADQAERTYLFEAYRYARERFLHQLNFLQQNPLMIRGFSFWNALRELDTEFQTLMQHPLAAEVLTNDFPHFQGLVAPRIWHVVRNYQGQLAEDVFSLMGEEWLNFFDFLIAGGLTPLIRTNPNQGWLRGMQIRPTKAVATYYGFRRFLNAHYQGNVENQYTGLAILEPQANIYLPVLEMLYNYARLLYRLANYDNRSDVLVAAIWGQMKALINLLPKEGSFNRIKFIKVLFEYNFPADGFLFLSEDSLATIAFQRNYEWEWNAIGKLLPNEVWLLKNPSLTFTKR
jgi:hypothetical protein